MEDDATREVEESLRESVRAFYGRQNEPRYLGMYCLKEEEEMPYARLVHALTLHGSVRQETDFQREPCFSYTVEEGKESVFLYLSVVAPCFLFTVPASGFGFGDRPPRLVEERPSGDGLLPAVWDLLRQNGLSPVPRSILLKQLHVPGITDFVESETFFGWLFSWEAEEPWFR